MWVADALQHAMAATIAPLIDQAVAAMMMRTVQYAGAYAPALAHRWLRYAPA